MTTIISERVSQPTPASPGFSLNVTLSLIVDEPSLKELCKNYTSLDLQQLELSVLNQEVANFLQNISERLTLESLSKERLTASEILSESKKATSFP